MVLRVVEVCRIVVVGWRVVDVENCVLPTLKPYCCLKNSWLGYAVGFDFSMYVISDFDSSEQYDVSGKIGTGKDSISQLFFSWKSPVVREVKRYKCEVKGVCTSGREMTISVTAETPSEELTVDTDDEKTVKENQHMVANVTQQIVVNNVDNPDSNSIKVIPAECRPELINRDYLEASTRTILNGVTSSTVELEENIENIDSDVESLQHKVDMLEESANADRNTIEDIKEEMSSFVEIFRFNNLVRNFDMLGVFKGKRYYVSKTAEKFDIWAADKQCSENGGHLVEVDDKAENDFLHDHINKVKAPRIFTGGNDIHNEGVWKFWHSNRPVKFSNWEPGEPNNSNNDDCIQLLKSGRFIDNSCDEIGKFICEGPM
ncbi:LOW QUALITY PROTEIN: collectin-11 [Elysia marginata]|uniref:Collectin-11 n=1 Tax=Elysia marginata TaxID=1093978 RepID=A0AAV4HPR2_9GAST|nr:LOW QUALITY PROTEIN: collectin-11 [Elysia marginata]